jgi:predicted  nucleic acid-binding Zn-ribbon protein
LSIQHDLDLLYELHIADANALACCKQIDKIPKQIEEMALVLDNQKAEVLNLGQQVQEKTAELDEFKRKNEQDEQQIAKSETKLKSVSSNEAYQAALNEVEQFQKQLSCRETITLECMEQLELLSKKTSDHESELSEAIHSFEEKKVAWQAEIEELKIDLVKFQNERSLIAERVDSKEMLKRYETVRAEKGLALVRLEREFCEGGKKKSHLKW